MVRYTLAVNYKLNIYYRNWFINATRLHSWFGDVNHLINKCNNIINNIDDILNQTDK